MHVAASTGRMVAERYLLQNTIGQIKDGAMVIESGEDSAIVGREFTKRKMPV